MGAVTPPAKIPFVDVATLPRPGSSLVTYVLLNASGQSLGQEFIFSDVDNDYVPVGSTAYNVIGTWNASNNTPDYTTTLTTNGDALVVVTAGTTNVNSFAKWNIGDLLVRENDIFFRAPNQSDIVASLTDNAIPMWANNQLEDSSMTEETDNVESSKSFETIAGSVFFSEALAIGSAGEAFSLRDVPNNRYGYLLGYERLDDGTGRPFFRKLGAKQTGVTIQPNKNTNTGSQDTTIPITFTANRLITAITLESTQTVTGATLTLFRGTTMVEKVENVSFTADTETTINIEQGLICSSGSTFNIQIEGVILKGTGTIGTNFELFLKVDNWIWSKVNLPDDGNLLSILAPKILAGSNVSVNYDSGADTFTISSTGGGSTPTASEIKTLYESNADTNAFTDAEQTKLAGIATGADANVQSDWNETNTSADSYIQNKPTILGTEGVEDIVGDMVTGNTETGISVTYDDTNGKLDFVVTGPIQPPQSQHTNYLDVTTDTSASSVNIGTAESSDDLNPTFTIPTFTGNNYIQILQSMAHTRFTSISIGGLNQIGGFTINDNARTISGQAYRQYVTTNLVTDSLSGQSLIAGGAS